GPTNVARPEDCADVNEPSKLAIGLGGSWSWSANVANACMSPGEIWPSRPSKPTNATLNFRNPWLGSIDAVASGCGSQLRVRLLPVPPERSPRQCMGPSCAMPRRVCVVIGPFSGWKSMLVMPLESTTAGPVVPTIFTNGLLFRITAPSGDGAPRSQASESKSANTWHTPHDASPFDELKWVSYRKRRPVVTDAGSGLCTRRWATSLREDFETT